MDDDAGGPNAEWLARCRKRMDEINALAPEMRALVDDLGWTIVKAFLDCGVRNHRHIRHLVITCWKGSEQGVAMSKELADSPLHARDPRRQRSSAGGAP